MHEVAADPQLTAALGSGTGIRRRMEQLIGGPNGIVAIELRSSDAGRLIARAGSPTGMAYKAAPLVAGAQMRGTLFVSLTDARDFAGRVRRLTGFHIGVFRNGRLIATTLAGSARAAGSATAASHTPSRSPATTTAAGSIRSANGRARR